MKMVLVQGGKRNSQNLSRQQKSQVIKNKQTHTQHHTFTRGLTAFVS